MSALSGIGAILQLLNAIPGVGKYLVLIAGIAMAVMGAATAFVAAWHGLVIFFAALAQIPGLSGLKRISDVLKADEDAINSFENNKLLPILDQLSGVPLPTTPSVKK